MKRSALTRKTPMHRAGPDASRSEHPQAKEGKCAQCGSPFMKVRPLQAVCSPVCAGRKVKADKKAERASDRKRKLDLKTIPDLIAMAQTAFNAFIRARDKDKGCFVCGRPFENIPGRVLHAGHVRSRGAAGHLRFHEDNCMGECEGCNGPYGAKPHEIEAGAIRRIGQERFDALKADNTPIKWTREHLLWVTSHYRQKKREIS